MEYKASYDTLTKGITISTIIIFILIIHKNIVSLLKGESLNVILAGSLILILAVLIGCYLYRVQTYFVDIHGLVIKRPMGNLTIPLTDIAEIHLINSKEVGSVIKILGNGGLFGYYGKYYNKFGSVSLYATKRKNHVFIQTKEGRKIIITPDNLGIVDHLRLLRC